MGFFFILFIVGIIIFLIVKHRNNKADEWHRAAARLQLSYSRGGLINPHWIYGRKAGLRFDIKTFSRSSGGSANQKWTGYRVRFPHSADVRIRVTESARKRLTSRFQEVEIDDEGIFCARPGIESDASALIDNAERLQSVTARLLAAADEEVAAPRSEPPAIPMPPPPLDKVARPEPGEAPEEEIPTAKVIEAEESEPLEAPEEVLFTANEAADEATASDPPTPPEEIETGASIAGHDLAAKPELEPEIETEPETESDEERLTLSGVSRDLFDSGRNRFQITQLFDTEYSGLSMIGEGKLVRAETYSNDRIFGRGPGTLAEVEIDHPEEPLPGHGTIKAVLQLPETTTVRSLRENIGDTVTISGTMLRCDAFDGRIFLGAGEIAP